MPASPHPVVRLIDLILVASKVLVFTTSVVFVTLVVLQVFFRYALNDSLVWAEEAIRFLLYLTVMGSLGLVAAADADIRLGGMDSMLKPQHRRLVAIVCDATVLCFCAVFIYASLKIVGMSWGQRSPVMEISMGWVYWAGIAGFALTVLGTLRKLIAGPYRLAAADETDLQYKA